MRCMVHSADPEVKRAPRLPGFVVAADVVTEEVVGEQQVPGEATTISWEDKNGRWHDEPSRGDDRPQTDVEG